MELTEIAKYGTFSAVFLAVFAVSGIIAGVVVLVLMFVTFYVGLAIYARLHQTEGSWETGEEAYGLSIDGYETSRKC